MTSQIQAEVGTVAFLVLAEDGHPRKNMKSFNQVVNSFTGAVDVRDLLCEKIEPEDNATIIFTSGTYHCCLVFLSHVENTSATGTTGLPKGVLSTQRQFLSNVLNVGRVPKLGVSRSSLFQVLVGGFRAALRNGLPLPSVQRPGPQAGSLVAVPLFHVTGSTSYSVSTMCLNSGLLF
jgi:acyl-CoA synthetase (AMP-forming)/AMP-acid ligase II